MYNGITITAHTGCEGTTPNSLESIKKGAEAGAEYVEFDIRWDGKQCVLSHNKKFSNPVTLKDALAEVAKYNGLIVNLDLKEFNHVKEVIAEVDAAGLRERVIITGVRFKNFRRVKKAAGDIPVFINCLPFFAFKLRAFALLLSAKLRRINAAGLNIHKKFASKLLVETIKEQGLLFSVWTINHIDEIKKIARLGPNNITTRIPTAFLK